MKPLISLDRNSLARAEETLRDDHRRLDQLEDLLQAAKGLPALLSAAEELRQALLSHFAHEEHPGGLYDSLKFCAPQHREELAQLVEDHRHINLAVWQLCQRARAPEARLQDLRREAAQFVKKLRQHEEREHEMAHQALGEGPAHRA